MRGFRAATKRGSSPSGCDRAKTVWGYNDSVWHCTREKRHTGPCALRPGNWYDRVPLAPAISDEEIPTPAPCYDRPILTGDDVKAVLVVCAILVAAAGLVTLEVVKFLPHG